MKRTPRDVDDFIAGLPDGIRSDIDSIDRVIGESFSGLDRSMYEGKMWGGTDQEIIGYGTYRYGKDEAEWFVVGLAAQKNHLSIYINVADGKQYLSEIHGPGLGDVKVGRAAIGFKSAADIDLGRLSDLMTRAREMWEAR